MADVSDVEDSYVKACYILIKEFKWTLEDLRKLPVPTFLILLEEMEKDYKEQEKQYKKSNSKTWR